MPISRCCWELVPSTWSHVIFPLYDHVLWEVTIFLFKKKHSLIWATVIISILLISYLFGGGPRTQSWAVGFERKSSGITEKGFPDTREECLVLVLEAVLSVLMDVKIRLYLTCDRVTRRIKSTYALKVTWRPLMQHFERILWKNSGTILRLRACNKRSILETIFFRDLSPYHVFPSIQRKWGEASTLSPYTWRGWGSSSHPALVKSHGVGFVPCL